MLPVIFVSLLAVCTIYYVYFITKVRLGLASLKPRELSNASPFVSVVIATRNEEHNIVGCLQSALGQTYPRDRFEVIVVDDDSTDGTRNLVESFSRSHPNVRIIALPRNENVRIGRKPDAIAAGVEQAKGEIILTTDADCLVPPRWVEIIAGYFTTEVALVSGPVREQSNDAWFSKFERLEFLGLITTGAGLIGAGRPIICNGANLAYRKSAYRSVRGFGDAQSSNDDESLMNRIHVRKVGEILFAPEKDAIVTTRSNNTFGSFLRQRIRWAGKRGHYKEKSILLSLIALYLFAFSFLAVLVLIPVEPALAIPASIVFLGKVVVDYFTLRAGSAMMDDEIPLGFFVVAELFHVPYIVIAAALGQIAPLGWKGRSLKR